MFDCVCVWYVRDGRAVYFAMFDDKRDAIVGAARLRRDFGAAAFVVRDAGDEDPCPAVRK